MINKFKDFLNNLRAKIRSTKPPALPGNLKLNGRLRFEKITSFLSKTLKRSGVSSQLQKTDWGALPDKLLAKESLTGHHRNFLIAFLLISTYSLGKITAIILRGRPVFDPPVMSAGTNMGSEFDPQTLNQVRNSDPFKSSGGNGKPIIADSKCESASGPTSLPIKLINTVVLQDSVKSIASVQVRSARELKEVHEGDSLDNMAKIARISRLELIIKNLETGACESVVSDKNKQDRARLNVMTPEKGNAFKAQQKIKGIENEGNKYIISKDLLNEKLKDINSVLTQARAIKIQNPDGSLAFKMTEIEPGGVFSYLGIQNDDVITSIDGRPITDLNEVMGYFGKLKTLDKLKLGIRREGEETELDYAMKQ